MPNHPRLTLLAGTACALATFLPAPRAHAADTLDWSGSKYTYNASTQVGTNPPSTGGVVNTVNGNTVSILYNTGSYFNAYQGQASPAAGTNTTNTPTYTDGGNTGSTALQILANFDSGTTTTLIAGSGISVTVFFSQPVSGLLFSFWDVDTSQTGSTTPYKDVITSLTGKNTLGAFVAPGLVANGSANSFSTGTFASNVNNGGSFATITGQANAAQTGAGGGNALAAAAGAATVQFTGTPITQFSFTYQDYGVTGTGGHSQIQMFGLSNLSFTTVPEPSTWATVGLASVAGAWALRRRARRMA